MNNTKRNETPLPRGILLSIALSMFISLSISCSSAPAVAGFDVAASDKERDRHPQTTTLEADQLAAGNAEFALRLYGVISEKGGNLFYSPFSISQALAMAYAGARGETETQMADTLHFTLPQAKLHQAFNWLDLELAKRGEGAKGADDKGFRLNIANSLWAQNGFDFQKEFLDTLAENYSSGIRLVDFVADTENARVTINRWVEEKTENRIKDLLQPGVVNDLTRLILVNAIYFNAAWEHQFPKELTSDAPFNTLDGPPATVKMMHSSEGEGMEYVKGDGYEALDVPYDANELTMTILLPDEGNYIAFEKSLNARKLDAITATMQPSTVILSMPKFRVESQFSLSDALTKMGMPIAFTDAADFSGMDGRRDLIIQDVIHKAFVDVTEAGTEAAAATAVVMGITSAPMSPIYFNVDRPFIFLIRDNPTGAILFAGRVLNPNE